MKYGLALAALLIYAWIADVPERIVWLVAAAIWFAAILEWASNTAVKILTSLERIEGYLSRRSDP